MVWFEPDPLILNYWPGSGAKHQNRRVSRRAVLVEEVGGMGNFRRCECGPVAGAEAGIRGPTGRGQAGMGLWPCLEGEQRQEQEVCFEGQLEEWSAS